MQYENRQAPEGINVTRHNPFLYFLKLLFLAFIVITVVVVLLNLLGARLARQVPFEYELTLMERIDHDFSGEFQSPELSVYLNELAERLKANMPIPPGMDMTVYYNSEDVFNAYATFGGNVVFYRELLKNLPHENALAMVVAHELAHVLHRDPIAGTGGGIASMVAIAALTGGNGTGVASNVLSQTGALTQLKFSRDMENAADRAALLAIYKTYGHVNGADELFRVFQKERGEKGDGWATVFSSTHPLDESRILAIGHQALEHEWPTGGALTPLPGDFQEWLGMGVE